ncbi:hypothetical protein [Peribacillus glennii]|uniref:hypothetical protein n=1 Tax=Peribacillus glennii TaxID=2303991 RepID=UPI0018F11932|nr:hypothetical protein [Peribacillus glennii]
MAKNLIKSIVVFLSIFPLLQNTFAFLVIAHIICNNKNFILFFYSNVPQKNYFQEISQNADHLINHLLREDGSNCDHGGCVLYRTKNTTTIEG